MTLARRLWLASAGLAILIGAAFVALIVAVSAQRAATEREARSKDATVASLEVEKLVLDLETGIRGLTITGSRQYLEPYERARGQLPGRVETLRALVSSDPAQLARATALRQLIRAYQAYAAATVALVGETPELGDDPLVTDEAKRYTDEIRQRFVRLRAVEDRFAEEAAQTADSRAQVAVVVGGLSVGASMALIALFGIVLSRSIGRPIREVAAGASRLAAGELSLRLPARGPGEVGELKRAFNAMAERLEEGRRELEAQNEELRESERMKTELVSIVSHELRTPLASILGFTSLLLDREFDAPSSRHYLGIVDKQARHLAALLHDLLDVERIERQGVDLATERVDLASLLDEQAELYALQSPKHQVELELEQRPLTVRGDPTRLTQVVGHLLSNAIKFSPAGGTVEVAAARTPAGVRVAVRDSGVGIPEEQQSRIFTKFFRGDAGAAGITGTGLGLAVSREIVEAHGGRIGFDSGAGTGTTFWLELPGANGDSNTNAIKEAHG